MNGTRNMLIALARYRSETRELVVDVLRRAGSDVVHQPRAIPGGNGDGSIYATYLHLVDVEESWLHEGLLAEGWKDGPASERYSDFDAIAAIWAQTSADWITYLSDHDDADLWGPFTNGHAQQIPTWMVVWHAFNHTTHHLAEIWTALTVAGITPPELDPLRWAGEQTWPFPADR